MNRLKKNIAELTRISAADYRRAPKLPLAVMADSVRSMNNIGSLFRTCDAFAVEKLILCGISGRPPHPEIAKTALGAERSVEWEYRADAVEAALEMRRQGYSIAVLEQTHGSVPLQDYRFPCEGKVLLIAGNEVEGVDQRLVDIADTAIEIPQYGTKHSLNVSVSAGIAIWQLFLRCGGLTGTGS